MGLPHIVCYHDSLNLNSDEPRIFQDSSALDEPRISQDEPRISHDEPRISHDEPRISQDSSALDFQSIRSSRQSQSKLVG